MPSIDITPEQAERLATVQEELATEVVGKYGHVRVQDAIEYLLDEHEDGDAAEPVETAGSANATVVDTNEDADADADANVDDETGPGANADADADADANGDGSAGDDAMLNAMMSLLDTHNDKWGESSGDERYEVTLPDGDVERVRTKDDVRALLFKHYR